MSLIAIGREDLQIGVSLPWNLFDRNGNVLAECGETIGDAAQRDALLAGKPMRELPWNGDAGKTDGTSQESAELDAAMQASPAGRYSFDDMRLRVGDRIQLQPPSIVSPERYTVRLIGYLDNSSLLVTLPKTNGVRVPLRENDTVVARIFSSQSAFGFSTRIERICKIPYDYMHLDFPAEIQGAVVRKAPRVRTRIIASIAPPDSQGETTRWSGVIVNLSANGALIKARQALGERDQLIRVSFRVNLHGIDTLLNVHAVLRSIAEDEANFQTQADPMINHGVQFQDVAANDSVILQSLIYQQMIEHPHTLA